MREILFRGKRKDTCKWIYGDLIQVPTKNSYSIIEHTPCAGVVEVIPETVGQYIGSTDKNGVKIFEGDIVECVLNIEDWEHNPETGKVVITEPVDEVVYKDNGFELKESPLSLWLYDGSDTCDHIVEVFGNIHDNPELLKEVKG